MKTDAINTKKAFRGLGIKEENIKEYQDVDWDSFDTIMNDMFMPAWMNSKTKKTCFFFSYSGHGGMNDGMTEAVLNKKPGT